MKTAMAFRELLGIEIAERGDGRAKLLFRAKDEHLNDGGIVHGGAIATLADCAMGSALASTLAEDERPVTVEAKINYLEPGERGTLVAVATVRRKGKRFTVLEAEVTQEETGEHVAYSTGTFTILDV
ncbi:MAG TPA: PaaI family thioesterase [Actinomycetota bacterium]|nr:PaaI family thioesterase [Actinomycetota bacterium]